MAKTYQITSITGEELEVIIQNSLAKALQSWEPPQPVDSKLPEYGTRKEVASILRISLPTVDDYIKRGILEAVRVGGRIRIRRTAIEKAVTEIKSLRYKRK